jgi:FKBP-type peptidyl-prolyl cis-trans isomerase
LNKIARKAAVVSVIAACVIAVASCGGKKERAQINEKSPFEDKAAYSVGASVGSYLRRIEEQQKEFVAPFNNKLVIKGFNDALKGKSKLTDKDIEQTLRALDEKIKTSMTEKVKAAAKKNLEDGKKFLEENKTKEGVKTTSSGLQYKVIAEGSGESPKEGDTVTVTYKGTTIDGKVFDEQKQNVDFPLQNMIPGWIEGLKLMKPGAEYMLYIPAELGYGEAGAGEAIAPNSVLVFDVKLVGVKSAPAKKEAKEENADKKAKSSK